MPCSATSPIGGFRWVSRTSSDAVATCAKSSGEYSPLKRAMVTPPVSSRRCSALEQRHEVKRHVLQFDPMHLADVAAEGQACPDLAQGAEGLHHTERPRQAYVESHPRQHRH